jgi:phosphatidylinositol glycan class V
LGCFGRYSESLYALFSLGGLFYLFSGANTVAMIMLAVSGSARSNGALNAGYFCFQALLQAYDAAIQKKRPIVS